MFLHNMQEKLFFILLKRCDASILSLKQFKVKIHVRYWCLRTSEINSPNKRYISRADPAVM